MKRIKLTSKEIEKRRAKRARPTSREERRAKRAKAREKRLERSKISGRRISTKKSIVISRRLVEKFLDQEMDDLSFLKKWGKRKVVREIENILDAPMPQFDTDPWKHQLVSLLIGLIRKRWIFTLDMGLGKSYILLMIILCRRILKERMDRILITVPNVTNLAGWEEQIEEHTDMKCVLLYGSAEERWEKLKERADVYIINYAGLATMLCPLTRVGKTKRRKRVPDEKLIDKFSSRFKTIMLDESHKCKNSDSITTRLCTAIAQTCEYRYATTGTPFNKPLDLWSQFYMIDDGETLGRMISIFKYAYFDEFENYNGGYDFELRKDMKEELQTRVLNRSIRYSDDECFDLPPLTQSIVKVPFSKQSGKLYRQAKKGIIESKDKVENIFVRLRQIASGYIDTVVDNEQISITCSENPKITWLLDKIETMPSGSKMIIFHEFTKSGDLICEALSKANIKHVNFRHNSLEAYRNFKKKKSIQVGVLNSASGGTGLNLQVAQYQVFFESPLSSIVRQQTDKRMHRGGQTKHCFKYDLVTQGSVEEGILKAIGEGKDLMKEIIDNPDLLNEL